MIAAGLVQNGAKVYIASRKKTVIDKTAAELTQMGPGQCIAVQADLGSKAACYKLAEEIAGKEEKLHILVNKCAMLFSCIDVVRDNGKADAFVSKTLVSAGVAFGGKLEEFREDWWDKAVNLNVKQIFYLTMAYVSWTTLFQAGLSCANATAIP